MSGQSGKTRAVSVAVTLRAEEQQGERRDGRERRQQREPLAGAARRRCAPG